MIIDNNWYGHRSIIAKYCGYSDRHVHALISHSQELAVYKSRRYPLGTFKHPILVWNKYELENALSQGCTHVYATGAPFLYLLQELCLTNQQRSNRNGTIIFPVHGVPGITVDQDVKRWIDLIKDGFPPPYCVSIPLFDPLYQSKKTRFEKAGVKVVSFGARTDRDYLRNFIGVASEYEFATSDDMGSTALIYCMALGLGVFHFSGKNLIDFVYRDNNKSPYFPERIRSAFECTYLGGDDAIAVASDILGKDMMVSPSDLSRLIGLDSLGRSMLAMVYSLAVRLKYGGDAYCNPDDLKIQKVNNTSSDLSSLLDLQQNQGINVIR